MPVRETLRFLGGHAHPGIRRYVVACSGGMDSVVLLHVLAGLPAGLRRDLRIIHVHHGLNPLADAWAEHVRELASAVEADFVLCRVRVDAAGSLEAAAREARYRALSGCLSAGDVLITAHHADDQAETVLLRLLRGSGLPGLGGMRPVAVVPFSGGSHPLWRPFLSVSRRQIGQYAAAHGLRWVEDGSNRDTRHARNLLRHRVMPVLDQAWPGAAGLLSAAAERFQEAAVLQAELAAIDMMAIRNPDRSLRVAGLLELPPPRRANLVRHWLADLGLDPPDREGLHAIVEEVGLSRPDGQPCYRWKGQEVRRYRGSLHGLRCSPRPVGADVIDWARRQEALLLPDGRRLEACLVRSDGFRPEIWRHAGQIRIRFRQGGETLRLPGRSHGKTLKHLFQEQGVPPWERERCPLVYADDRLIQVAGYWTDAAYAVGPDEQGVSIRITETQITP